MCAHAQSLSVADVPADEQRRVTRVPAESGGPAETPAVTAVSEMASESEQRPEGGTLPSDLHGQGDCIS